MRKGQSQPRQRRHDEELARPVDPSDDNPYSGDRDGEADDRDCSAIGRARYSVRPNSPNSHTTRSLHQAP